MAFGTGEGHAFEAWQLHFAARFGGWKAANLGGGFLSVQKTALGTTGCWQRGASVSVWVRIDQWLNNGEHMGSHMIEHMIIKIIKLNTDKI